MGVSVQLGHNFDLSYEEGECFVLVFPQQDLYGHGRLLGASEQTRHGAFTHNSEVALSQVFVAYANSKVTNVPKSIHVQKSMMIPWEFSTPY